MSEHQEGKIHTVEKRVNQQERDNGIHGCDQRKQVFVADLIRIEFLKIRTVHEAMDCSDN